MTFFSPSTYFISFTATTGGSAKVEVVALTDDQISFGKTSWMAENTSKSERPDLTAARVVVSGGRGLKSGENFAMLEKLADKLVIFSCTRSLLLALVPP